MNDLLLHLSFVAGKSVTLDPILIHYKGTIEGQPVDVIPTDADVRRVLNRMNRLFEAGARKLGFDVERVLQARKNCIGSGYCMTQTHIDQGLHRFVIYNFAVLHDAGACAQLRRSGAQGSISSS